MSVLRIAALAALVATVAVAQSQVVNNVTCPSVTFVAFGRPAACDRYYTCETQFCKCLGNATAASTAAMSCIAALPAPTTCGTAFVCASTLINCLEGVMYQSGTLSAGCQAWVATWNNALATQALSFASNASQSPFAAECRAFSCGLLANGAGSLCSSNVGPQYKTICDGFLALTTTTAAATAAVPTTTAAGVPTTTSAAGATTVSVSAGGGGTTAGATTAGATTAATTKAASRGASVVLSVVAALVAIVAL